MADGSKKQRLSAMLDVDLSNEVANEAPPELNGKQADSAPTLQEWLQAAGPVQLKECLKELLALHPEIAEHIKAIQQAELAHQDWVDKQEKEWVKPPEAEEKLKAEQNADVSAVARSEEFQSQLRYIPLRLTSEERGLLNILKGALHVSEYTDKVDIYHVGSKARRMATQIQQVCAIIAGLVVANNFDVARRPLTERSFADNQNFFRAVFEIGRRYKILNPGALRGTYGKLLHMLQDSVKDDVVQHLDFECVSPVKSVCSVCQVKTNGAALLQDPLMDVATREIYEAGKSRAEITEEVKAKESALKQLKQKYGEPEAPEGQRPKNAGDLGELLRGSKRDSSTMTQYEVELIVKSIGDHFSFQRFNQGPVDRMLHYLKSNFSPNHEADYTLEISRGRGGSCLSHSHRTQYTFVMQSLLLWREIMGNMYPLWSLTEQDFLDAGLRYRLCDTGQGLNRLQSAPRVSKMMHSILHKVQREVGGWVGLSVVHLGDRDVPNALVFIDKYTQVPTILGPIVSTLDKIPEVYASNAKMKSYIDKEFGGAEPLKMMILQDFFRHGFDGSGDDGGSCVDGRLTSCWNWCSKIEKKKYFPAFLLTGFIGFDGSREE